MERQSLDCVIVGGGPAGLSAALYLSRFRRRVIIVDSGQKSSGKNPDKPQSSRVRRHLRRNAFGFDAKTDG